METGTRQRESKLSNHPFTSRSQSAGREAEQTCGFHVFFLLLDCSVCPSQSRETIPEQMCLRESHSATTEKLQKLPIARTAVAISREYRKRGVKYSLQESERV